MIFQSPYASLDPVQTIGGAVAEALVFSHSAKRGRAAKEKTEELFGLVGLPFGLAKRRPFALSGGQAQRAAIARALALRPSVLIADEATAMLDVMTQARIAELLGELSAKLGLAVIYISHDSDFLRRAADRITVLEHGTLREEKE